jgi:anti-sigma regulatory factor (Ser/Thr protein kinase)
VTGSSSSSADATVHLAITFVPTVPAPRYVARAVGRVVTELVGPHRHDDIVLAVHEVVANAVRHGPPDAVSVQVVADAAEVHIDVVDAGDGGGGTVTPFDVPVGDPSGRDDDEGAVLVAGGRGLVLARALSDDLDASLDGSGHVVRLTYRRTD